jgi:hypothetical protein
MLWYVEMVDNITLYSRIRRLPQLRFVRFRWSMHRRDLGECEKREGVI